MLASFFVLIFLLGAYIGAGYFVRIKINNHSTLLREAILEGEKRRGGS